MIVGVIGSGSIGPDLAYGFASALAGSKGSKVYLLDIKQEALDRGLERINGYLRKGLSRGKIHPKAAAAVEASLQPTTRIEDLADCEYVLEAATEDLQVKKVILSNLEDVVAADCLIGFATSGIPRKRIAAETRHPERCFVNHPFFPAWRSPPMEVVLSGESVFEERMLATLTRLGKVPIITADVPCFAADDVFVNYCAEAARLVAEGIATPAQVDKIVNDAVGGGGPFNVMDLTRGNLLNVHCMELMRDGPTGSAWFAPPEIFSRQGLDPWHDRAHPGDPSHGEDLGREVRDRILAVLLARTYFVVDNEVCSPTDFNWLSRMALGFRDGLLDLAENLGADEVERIVSGYAATHPGFTVPESIATRRLAKFYRNLKVESDGEVAVLRIFRPEVKNALNDRTMAEIQEALGTMAADPGVKGVVLTSFDGSLAGADIMELAALATPAEAVAKCERGHAVMGAIEAFPKPIVAAVDGPVLGGGAELSMSCHGRVVGRHLILGQPEVNLGIIPGYGGTQRLPRLIGVERGIELLRTGRPVGAQEACAWGWAWGEPVDDPVAGAKKLLAEHLAGRLELRPVDPSPVDLPDELPVVDIGHRSLRIDEILVQAVRAGLVRPLAEGLHVEAEAFGRCKETVDYDIGMKNFIQNGPRVPACFMHE